jgi:GTP-binding protein
MLPTVAILGRPNVGKSTLFNRLVGRRLAIVDDTPGVTRDRKEAETRFAGRDVRLIDTAGLEEAPPDTIPGRMRASSEAALAQADVVLFVVDVRTGLTPPDRAFAAWLRRAGLPCCWWPTRRRGGSAPRRRWRPMSSASATRSPSPPSTGRASPT